MLPEKNSGKTWRWKGVMMVIEVINKSHHPLPAFQSAGAAGVDLQAYIPSEDGESVKGWTIHPGHRLVVPTGLYMQLPIGVEAQIRPRSGLAAKHGVTVLNSPGTIDSDYRGEIKVILYNAGSESFCVLDGARIAQMVIARYEQFGFQPVLALDETQRGGGGFGHTGI